MRRRTATAALLLSPLAVAAADSSPSGGEPPKKVLRYAFRVAESGFDPAKINDLYSRTITPHIFEGLYTYDHLARPAKMKPLTADGMPENSADFRIWTVKLKRGIYFASDPAFKGQRRELVAEDYVFAFKRYADPANKSPNWTGMESQDIVGLNALREEMLKQKKPFDYDKPIEGLRALDRYTIQFKLGTPDPRFGSSLAQGDLFGAVAREVVEMYKDDTGAHPVGTGPFRLVQWRRSSLIVLERNPEFREMFYEAEPGPEDAEGQALLKRLKGRRLPMIDRVEISIIEENQPRWLSFLQKQSDLIEEVPADYVERFMPGGRLTPLLAKQGVQGYRMVRSEVTFTYFNMDDPVVGGYTPEKVALRRAISLGLDVDREIRTVRRSQAVPAQSAAMPHSYAFNSSYKSENSEYSPAKAKALLDMYGYLDKDGDGWREMPDGSPLLLEKSTQPDQVSRALDEQWQRDMTAIGLRVRFLPAKFQENLKAARAGKLMIWSLATGGAGFDSQDSFSRYSSGYIGGQNMARFKRPETDALFDRLNAMPDGPERLALFEKMKRLTVVYAPYKFHVHRVYSDMAQPWLIGYRRPVFWQEYWQYLDIDTSKLPKA